MSTTVDKKPRSRRRPPHPLDAMNQNLPPEYAKSRYGKWRALSLIFVYVLMIVHITHWKVSGKTMAPLELSEIMKALELGVVSPGVIFIGIMLIGSALLGRFFCAWGCHMLAAQDLFHWILKKLRIRPIAIRSRVLLLGPFLAATYMFFWPQIKRLIEGRELPDASARLITTNFWRDLPGPVIIALTFITCGFFVVYFFGGRGFCRYGCPYGILFGLFDRLSPGKIRSDDPQACAQCGRCTAICTSTVRVHEEIKAYGMVVSPQCLKDLDCVSVCPNNLLHYRWGRPTVARRRLDEKPASMYDFSIAEEIAMLIIGVFALFAWRGLYDKLPFLMSLALSAVTAYVFISCYRLIFRREVKVNRYVLKADGRLRRGGKIFAAAAAVFVAFTLHSAAVRYSERLGDYYLAKAESFSGRDPASVAARKAAIAQSVSCFTFSDRIGLVSTTELDFKLGAMLLKLDRNQEAEERLRRAVERAPTYPEARITLAKAMEANGRLTEAGGHLTIALDLYSEHEEQQDRFDRLYAKAHTQMGDVLLKQNQPDLAKGHYTWAVSLNESERDAHFGLARIAAMSNHLDEAAALYRRVIELDPKAAEAESNLGDVLTAQGKPQEAIAAYEAGLAIDPMLAGAHVKAGLLSFGLGRVAAAEGHFAEAVRRQPDDAALQNQYGAFLQETGKLSAARAAFEKAVALNGDYADAHFNLGLLLAQSGEMDAANEHLKRAVALDARYARLIEQMRSAGRQ